jgi:hypothetical protein
MPALRVSQRNLRTRLLEKNRRQFHQVCRDEWNELRQRLRYTLVMLDVHPPHKAIGNAGEFFLHLFTITIGLLIAVGIEAAVEHHQHRELAREARETMKEEIRKNAESTNEALRDISGEQQRMKGNLAGVRKVQLNPNDPSANDLKLDFSYNTTGLDDTGWKTAQATGALAFMPYAESTKYSAIYGAEQAFLKAEDQLADDEAHFLGTIERFHIGKGKMTKDAADAIAEQFGISQGHLLALKIAAVVLQEQQNAFLEGREPKHDMSERIAD